MSEDKVCETCGHDCHCNYVSNLCCEVTERNEENVPEASCECPTCQHD